MNRAEFERARSACALRGAEFVEGSYLKGNPSRIEMHGRSDGGQQLECVANLFGGDGVTKKTDVSFVMGYNT